MKTRSGLYFMLFAATAFSILSQCSGNKKEEAGASSAHEHADSAADASGPATFSKPQFVVDAAFQHQLASVFNAYVSLKDALVSSEAGNVKALAASTRESLVNVDMKLLSGAAHSDWMNYLAVMEGSLKEMESTEEIEAQRKTFSLLSDSMYKSIKAFGLGGSTVYYEYCPMALNNQGAYWLSKEETIRNPYFGAQMLTCGEVKEKLQ